MIGNKIEFSYYDFGNFSDHELNKPKELRLRVGIVVDAFNKTLETNIGTGESRRVYKVECINKFTEMKTYINIYDFQLVRILVYKE